MTLTITVIDVKIAAMPKASGEKSLVTIGIVKMPRLCAITVPVISFKTLEKNLFDGFVNELIFIEIIIYLLRS